MTFKTLLLGALTGALMATAPAHAEEGAAKAAPAPAIAPSAAPDAPSVPAPKAVEPALDAAIGRLQKAYEGMKSFKANITQTSRLSTLSKEEVQKGELILAKPGKIRWTFTEPTERLFISDGAILSIYNKEDNQVIQQPLAGQRGVGLDFLLGLGDVRKDFDVTAVTDAEYVKEGRDALALKPKTPAGAITRLIFSIDQTTGLVQEAWTFDPMDNRTHLAFHDLVVNPEVDAALFTFTPPEGAEVIEAGGM